LGRLAHQGDGAGLDLARHQDAADAVAMRALVALDEFESEVEFPLARGFVEHAHELAGFAADPAAAVEARTEIGAGAGLADRLEQCLLDAQLAAELDECGNAVAQEFRYREAGIEAQLFRRGVVVGADVARIAADARALACDADFEEWLAEIVAAPDIGDQPVRRAVAGMNMGIDESRCDQLVAGVDLAIDLALEALAYEQHAIAFTDELGVPPQSMMPVGMRTQPAAGDARAHGRSSPIPVHPHSDNLRRRMQPPGPSNEDVRARA